MNSPLENMARDFYGYGRWDAPYWFIGLEQGGEDNDARAAAFAKQQSNGLCDCKDFHVEIGEERWHRDYPALQRSWRRLMLLLSSFTGTSSDNDDLRNYQRDHWAMKHGDTCVIELCGLSAKNLSVTIDRKSFLDGRIAVIRRKIVENKPKLVTMYGYGAQKHWEALVGRSLTRGEIFARESTVFVFAPHPTSHGPTDVTWKELGLVAANQFCSSRNGGLVAV
jgi:hypothetical protein